MFSWLLDPVPRFLYKYVPQDRWDIVQNLQIRFTQFYGLNDLFEAQGTYYDAEIREVEVLFPYWYNPMGTRIPIDGLKRNVKIRARVPLAGWRSQSLQELKYIWKEQVDERLNYLHASLPRLGVLSLAAAPDNPTMWTHYSTNHAGMVIKLDTRDFIFSMNYVPKSWSRNHHDLFRLTKVKYQRDVPLIKSVHSQKSLEKIVFTKGEKWSYEEEWRLCRPLVEAVDIIETDPFPICLFPISPSCIRAIYFGINMKVEAAKTYISSIRSDIRYGHIEFYIGTHERGTYSVTFKRLIP